MGLGSQGKHVMHKIVGLSMYDIAEVAKGRARDNGIETPTIVSDCSNMAYIYKKSASIIVSLVNHFVKWVDTGLVVIPVCDGPKRPDSKQATTQRIANSDKKRIKSYTQRATLRQLKKRHEEESMTEQEKQELLKEIKKLEKKCKTNDTLSQTVIPKNFAEELKRELYESGAHVTNPSTNGSVGDVAVAEFQADCYMAGQIINKKAVMVQTRDVDIPIICGGDCIAISKFTTKKFEVTCTSKSTLEDAMKHLPKNHKAKLVEAECPVFDGIETPRLRALMMIILGCDVYGQGMKGLKASKIASLITSYSTISEQQLYANLFDKLKTTNKLSPDVIDTYIDALLYEPSNALPSSVDEENPTRTYLFGAPDKLPKYLEQFAVDEQFKARCIVAGPEISICHSVGTTQHPFLSSDGVTKCTKCDNTVCRHCQDDINNEPYCMRCVATESLVPQSGSVGSKSIAKMRQELVNDSFDGARELSTDEVEDAYEMMEYLRQYREQATDVPYPLYSTSEMEGGVSTKWDELIEINFKEGGSFLAEPDLKAKYIPGVLDLFASLVRFESGKKTEWMKDAAVYDALPSLFIKFASGSRVDSGYRLLMRCVRHAFDSRAPSLDNQSASLILHEGSVGIQLNAAIPASMKKQVYECGVVATAKDILCCQCGCQCGSKGKEKQVCVHILPLLFLLTILLFEDLAEHMLLELAACMSSDIWDKSVWTEDDIEWMKRSIITLAEAAGEPVNTHKQTDAIEDLLEKFVVGTQRRKTWKQRIKTPPKPSELGPIHKMRLQSTAKLASCKVKHCTDISEQILVEPTDDNDQAMEDTIDLFNPDYVKVWSLMEAADCAEGMLVEDFAGIELLGMRSDKGAQSRDKLERTKLSKQATKDWKELERLANKRSIRNIDKKINNLPTSTSDTESESPTKKTKTEPTITPPPPLAPKKKKPSYWCACEGCNNNNVNSPNIKFHQIPKIPAESKSKTPRKDAVISRAGKILLRREAMDRIGLSRYNTKKKYVCEQHNFEVVTKRTLVSFNGKQWSQQYRLTVPCGAGVKSSLTPSDVPSKGNAHERAMRRLLAEANDNQVPQSLHDQEVEFDLLYQQLQVEAEQLTNEKEKNRNLEEQNMVLEAKLELAKSDTALASKAVQQLAEETCKETNIPINDSVRLAAGMGTTKGNASSVVEPNRHFFHSDPIERVSNKRNMAADCDPQVYLSMSDSEVKRRTGFSSKKAFLSYVFVVCNGDIDTIKKRQTSLTWYEEWFLHFEFKWGKSLTRID